MAKKEKSRIYLFQGRDDYSKTKAVEELLREVTDPDFELFDRDEMTGDSATVSRIITGACIWCRSPAASSSGYRPLT